MRHAVLGILVITLAACWDPKDFTHDDAGADAAAGGSGTGGAATCATCGAALAASTLPLCAGSSSFFASIKACACDPTTCDADCNQNVCLGAAMDAVCKNCLFAKCASKLSFCEQDQSTQ